MFTVDISKGAAAAFDKLATRLPSALSRAANNAAFEIRKAERDNMPAVLDRPRAAMVNAIIVNKADPLASEIVTTVGFQATDPGFAQRINVAMGLQELGGDEIAADVNRAWISVPIKAERDQYGGMPRGYIQKMLGSGGGLTKSGKKRKIKQVYQGQGQAWVGVINGIHGLWLKPPQGTREPVLLVEFKEDTHYKARLGFEAIADQVAGSSLDKYITQALDQAIGSSGTAELLPDLLANSP